MIHGRRAGRRRALAGMLTAACFAAGPAVAQDLHPQDMTCENFLILMLAGIAWNYCENPASRHYYALSPEGLDRTDRDPWGAGQADQEG